MFSFTQLSRLHENVQLTGKVKVELEDFIVEEIMPVQPSGQGEHLWLHIEKRGCNTDWLAKQLAAAASVKPMAVSYAGLKDRQGVTSQWFSIHLPGLDDPDLSDFSSDEFTILQSQRHDRKLKRGTLSGNHFKIRIRDLAGPIDHLQEILQNISQHGVANYFGQQRFGIDMNNLGKAEAMFNGRFKKLKKHQRSLYLSAARSWIFNHILSQRIQQSNWDQCMPGDVFMLDGKRACFADDGSADVDQRLQQLEIHPTGALWGEGQSMASGDCLQLEQSIADRFPVFRDGLIAARLKQERRALRLVVNNFDWQIQADQLMLSFDLPAGAYATMVLREIISTV